ncbi:amino acid permease-associated region [Granulicella tundricola MP5ACTX9]|uniref:Amino acid permease-associated region n=2 Tax=Granulicella TaxID=940557 RepID=E8X4Q7_GRATM|nr:amino acid permease-associated region [Granulicella tundricola MP5ACTX9]
MASSGTLVVEEHRLDRQLGLRDLVLTQILCVVGSSWVGVAAGLGRAQTVMWVAAMVLFYVPMAAAVIGLNRAMPMEGGLYAWAHRAFGNLGGFLTAWNLWVYGLAVTATILYALPTELAYLIGPTAAWLPENHLASVGIVTFFLALLTIAALRGLNIGKWIHNVGGIAMLTIFAVLILLPLWGLARHMPIHWAPLAYELPRRDLRSLALFGQMLFGAQCGLEYVAILAGESKSPEKTIGRSVWISSPIICAMFIFGTSSVLAFSTPGHIDFIAPIPQTLRIALGSTGIGNLFAIAAIALLQFRLIGAASYIFTGVTRLPMAVGWDDLLPEWFTRLHPTRRTPTNSILCTAGLVFLLVVMGGFGVHAQEAYQLLQGASLTHYEIAYLAMFAIPLVGAGAVRKELPPSLKWISLVGLGATLFSLLISAYPVVDVISPLAFAVKILGTTAVSNLVALGFYMVRRRKVSEVPSVALETSADIG